MRCMLCGTANREDANKCKQCGSDLTKESKPFSSGRSTPAPTILMTNSPESNLGAGGRKTEYLVPESDADSVGVPVAPREAAANRNARKTQFIAPDEAASLTSQASNKPKLVGFLVSYTWNIKGDAFKIYDGKNSFGSSSTVDSPVPSDRAMSSEHFVVMVRGGRIKVRDLTTTNATTVDGVEIWGDSADATHGTKIKSGDTEFVLVLIP